ncbi:MAG: LysE family translocator [Pikeienuella sp.]
MFTSKASFSAGDMKIEAKSLRKALWESVTVETLNPKTAIFYVAFLPQFTDPAAGQAIWTQLLILGTIVNVMFSSADVLCVVLADKVTTYFKSSGSGSCIAQRVGGGILVALGVNVALKG